MHTIECSKHSNNVFSGSVICYTKYCMCAGGGRECRGGGGSAGGGGGWLMGGSAAEI